MMIMQPRVITDKETLLRFLCSVASDIEHTVHHPSFEDSQHHECWCHAENVPIAINSDVLDFIMAAVDHEINRYQDRPDVTKSMEFGVKWPDYEFEARYWGTYFGEDE